MSDETALVVDVEPRDDTTLVVRVRGEFDLAGVDRFRAAVEDGCQRPAVEQIELDLDGVTFIDSSGVGAIVVASRETKASGRSITIGSRSAIVDRVLEVSGLEDALGTASD